MSTQHHDQGASTCRPPLRRLLVVGTAAAALAAVGAAVHICVDGGRLS